MAVTGPLMFTPVAVFSATLRLVDLYGYAKTGGSFTSVTSTVTPMLALPRGRR